MGHRRAAPPRPPAVPPRSAEEGAARISAAVVPIFDKGDGHGADWRLLVESMFTAAFIMLDSLPEDKRRSVARRAHEGSYRRTLPGPVDANFEPSRTQPDEANSELATIAGFKSKVPRPPH